QETFQPAFDFTVSMNQAADPLETSLYTPAFLLLCLSHGLFAASFNMMLPELPSYLASLGGGDYKGLIIAVFTLTAGLSRPFSGKLADTIGRMPVMYIGVLACVVCGLLYPVLTFVSGFLWLRFFHGFSTGFKPTGTSAYVADIVPGHRRGEAMGILGICLSIGASASPPLGSWLAKAYSINVMFYASTVLAALSMLILLRMKETLHAKQPFSLQLLRIGRNDIFDPLAIPAGIAMLCCYFGYGVILTLVPDLCDAVGVANRGTFFTIATLSSVATRFFAGKISDQLGRVPVLKASALLIAAAMGSFALSASPGMVYVSSAVFGLGIGIFSPAITAWTVDLGDPARRGRALATMYIALEMAIGGGAALSGWYYGNELAHMPLVFWSAAAASLAGFAYLSYWEARFKTV
ncbi:MAG TPA: MFS transporter, partial [Saprospiraceae bacterium]|nr:MFS transporter [Saprospiraceae bacterium]